MKKRCDNDKLDAVVYNGRFRALIYTFIYTVCQLAHFSDVSSNVDRFQKSFLRKLFVKCVTTYRLIIR